MKRLLSTEEKRILQMIERATIEEAKRWKREPEKWMLCTDILGISLMDNYHCDEWVTRLEEKYVSLLEQSGQ